MPRSVLAEALAGALDHLAHVLDAGGHGRHLLERPAPCVPATARASVVLPVPGGPHSSTDDRRSVLDEAAQRPARAEQVVLADDVVDGARPQPRGQRRLAAQALLGGGGRTGRQPPIAEHRAR